MISKITDQIFIGSASDARSQRELDKHNITDVLNVAKDLDDGWDDKRAFYKVGLTDGSNNPKFIYSIAINLVANLLHYAPDTRLLIHCHEGRSRSALIASVAIAEVEGTSIKEAYEKVCLHRPLCKQMCDYFKDRIGIR